MGQLIVCYSTQENASEALGKNAPVSPQKSTDPRDKRICLECTNVGSMYHQAGLCSLFRYRVRTGSALMSDKQILNVHSLTNRPICHVMCLLSSNNDAPIFS